MGALKWGLKVLVLDCPHLPAILIILRRNSLYKRAQKATKMYNCRRFWARVAQSGLESPHLRAPIWNFPILHLPSTPTCWKVYRHDSIILGLLDVLNKTYQKGAQ